MTLVAVTDSPFWPLIRKESGGVGALLHSQVAPQVFCIATQPPPPEPCTDTPCTAA